MPIGVRCREHTGKCKSHVADCSYGEKSVASKRFADLDKIIHQALRLKIMAALSSLRAASVRRMG